MSVTTTLTADDISTLATAIALSNEHPTPADWAAKVSASWNALLNPPTATEAPEPTPAPTPSPEPTLA